MKLRSSLANLRKSLGHAQQDDDVRAISQLMDELSAQAAGGGVTSEKSSLEKILNDAPQPDARRSE